MYLFLGQDTVVNDKDIIGIFDIDTTTVSKKTRDFLKKAEEKKQVINVTFELPKSFVICNNKENTRVYISQLSTSTLEKRSKKIIGY